MSIVKIKDKTFKTSIPEEEILKKVQVVADRINQDMDGKNPLFLAVLNGAFMFAADLMRMVTIPSEISFVKYASYEGTSSTGNLKQLLGINLVEGAHSIHHSLEICCFGKHRHVQHASVTLRSQAASAEIECHKRDATLDEIAPHLAVVHTRGTETVRKHCNGKWSLPFWILNLPVYAHVIAHDNELFNHLGILPKHLVTNVVIVREYIVI